MFQRSALMGAILIVAAAGCSPQTVTPPTATPTASPSPSPSPSSNPSTPAASPSASTPVAGFALDKGIALAGYSPVDPIGVFYDPGLGNIYVADTLDREAFPRRYALRRLNSTGVLTASSNLTPEGGKAPTAVDGVGFDLSSNPVVSTRTDEAFNLYKVVTANVLLGDRYPVYQLPRTTVSSASSRDGIVTTAVLSFDPDKTDKVNGQINYGRGKEDKVPEALFRIPDPFYWTVRMAVSPAGNVYLAGPTRDNKLMIKKLSADRTVTDLPAQLPSIPDGMWVGPDERLYLAWNQGGSPATVRRVNTQGAIDAESVVRIQAGGFISNVRGIAVNERGGLILVGVGFDANNKDLSAVVTFPE